MKHSADRHADILLTVNENATAQCVMQARSPVDTEETWTHSALNINKENRSVCNDVHLKVSHGKCVKPLNSLLERQQIDVVYISISILFGFMCPMCPLNPCHFECLYWLSPKVNWFHSISFFFFYQLNYDLFLSFHSWWKQFMSCIWYIPMPGIIFNLFLNHNSI